MDDSTTIGFVGTGIMGAPMAQHLAEKGFRLRVYNRTPEKAMTLAQYGADVVKTPADAASGADVLVTMVSDAGALRTVMEGPDGALSALASGALWIQCATVGLEGLEDCARWTRTHGARWVDAPVLGTRGPAEAGKLTVLASGPDAARDEANAVFRAFSQRILWVGDAGAGTRLKLVANAWVLGVNGALAEVMGLAEVLGVPKGQFLDAISGGPLDCGYAHAKGRLIQNDSFPASFPLKHALKDVRLIATAGSGHGARLDGIDGIGRALARAAEDGLGDEDMAAVFRAVRPSGAS
jgi:3-hydroxyisobutyrate dehydrogenase